MNDIRWQHPHRPQESKIWTGEPPKLKIKRLQPDAMLPTRANLTDAGLDLYALEDVEIPPTHRTKFINATKQFDECDIPVYTPEYHFVTIGQAKIPTGVAVEIPAGHYGKVSSRSGLAFKHGIFSFDGTIDSGYRGEIGVLLYNTTDKSYQVKKGDRIAQLLIIPCAMLEPVEADELTVADRGEKGFGASGR
jgi:dUTP pyrophosphatase